MNESEATKTGNMFLGLILLGVIVTVGYVSWNLIKLHFLKTKLEIRKLECEIEEKGGTTKGIYFGNGKWGDSDEPTTDK